MLGQRHSRPRRKYRSCIRQSDAESHGRRTHCHGDLTVPSGKRHLRVIRQGDRSCARACSVLWSAAPEARGYFEDLGFVHLDGANTADFLTAVTATNERRIQDGFAGPIPTTPADFAELYQASDIAKRMREEVKAHLADEEGLKLKTQSAQHALQAKKAKTAFKSRPERANYFSQVRFALVRDSQQRWGDKWTLWVRQGTTVIQALIVGSLFYSIPDTTNGLFLRGGTVFLSLLFPLPHQLVRDHCGFFRSSGPRQAQGIFNVPTFGGVRWPRPLATCQSSSSSSSSSRSSSIS